MNQTTAKLETLLSPRRLFFRVLAAVFLAELVVMAVLFRYLHVQGDLTRNLLDSTALTLLLAPFLWWWLIRPLRSAAMSEAILAANVINTSADGIITIDEGRIAAFNPAAERLFGYAKEEAIGQNLKMLMPPPEREQHDAHLGRYLRTGEKKVIGLGRELVARRKDGATFPIYLSLSEAREGDRAIFTGIVHDLTDRKRAEEVLRESEQRYRSLFENMLEGYAYCRMLFENDTPIDFIYIEVNLAFESLTGLKNVIGKKVSEVIPGIREANPELIQTYGRVALTGKPEQFETYLESLGIWFSIAVYSPAKEHFIAVFDNITERKQTEKEQARLTAILQATTDMVATADLRGLVQYINQAGRKMLGLGEDEDITNTRIPDYHPEWAASMVTNVGIPAAIESGFWSGETALLSRDGREIPLSQVIIAHAAPDGTIEYLSTIGRDITERKQAEGALEKSERHFRSLIENALDLVWVLNVDGTWRYQSPSTEALLGYAAGELVGQVSFELIHSEDAAKVQTVMADNLQHPGVARSVECRLRHRNGSWRVIEGIGKYVVANLDLPGVVINARDITERKQAEAELVRLAVAVEQTADSVMITDINGNIQYVNPSFERLSGYSKQEVLGQNPRILKSEKTDPSVYRDLWETITSGEIWVGQLTNRRKDGTLFEEHVTISPVRDNSGRIVDYIAVKQDTTLQTQLEAQLRQSQKLEAVGQLAGGVAHDFNNLLTAINGYSSLALKRLDDASPLKSYIEEIKKAGDRAANLTRQLLAFSRKQILEPKVLDLNDVVSDLYKMLRRVIGEDIELSTSPTSDLGTVKADPGQIEQIIMNLVVNARDAMPSGGKVTIETASFFLDEEYAREHPPTEPGQYVMLAVSDTGIGMDAETQARIFEPFFTTKEQGKGTGLGLSTVYGIVKQSGGFVWVYSEPGHGTTFKIYLPQVDAEKTTEVKPATEAAEHGSETILLVEDEDVVRKLVREILDAAGYEVLVAARGEEAIRLCIEHAQEIHLLLSDVVMPGGSGKEIAERLISVRPEMKVLFMSGYTDVAIVRHGVLDSAVKFIQKPFSPAALSKKVREVLDSY